MSRIHVLHENSAWLPPLAQAFDQRWLPWTEWFLDAGTFDLAAPPPRGIFYNRMSASSHTRDHRFSAELTAAVLSWLTRWDRCVVNGPGALDLEISKARQMRRTGTLRHCHAAHRAGRRPRPRLRRRTKAFRWSACHSEARSWRQGARRTALPVQRQPRTAYLTSDAYEAPVDGLHLLQEYVRAPRLIITRAAFGGGRFLYAVEVDTSDGFELCPADVCAIGDANCPVGETPQREKFTILDGIADPLRVRLERFLTATGVEVAGIEFIVDTEGRTLVYDVNTNATNYNPTTRRRAQAAPARRDRDSRRDRGIPGPRAAATARCGLTIIRAVSCWPLHSCAHHLRSSFGRCRHSQQCVACRGHYRADHGNLREPPYPLRSGRRRIGASGSRATGERPALRASRWRHVEPPHVCHIAL